MYAHGKARRPGQDRVDTGAYCPNRSMVREPYDGIIGDAPIGAIPLRRVATLRGSLRRHVYLVGVEGMMSHGRQSSAKPAGLSQLNLNAAGIDVGATSHFAAVPADRAEQPVQEFEAFTADLYRLADWLAECGVETVVMESTGVYWIPPVRGAGRTGLPGDAGGPQAHQERAWSQDRRAGPASGYSSSTPTACCRGPSVPTGRSDAYAVTCGSGSCWCSTHPTISSICRRR